jgi:hypothetical protein
MKVIWLISIIWIFRLFNYLTTDIIKYESRFIIYIQRR